MYFDRKYTRMEYGLLNGKYQWTAGRELWAHVKTENGRALLSSHGLAFSTVAAVETPVIMLNDFDCLTRETQVLFITHAEPSGLKCKAQAVAAPIAECKFIGDSADTLFQAVVTEMWQSHAQEEPMQLNVKRLLLLYPKANSFAPTEGYLVEVNGTNYEIVNVHALDPTRWECEIERRYDL